MIDTLTPLRRARESKGLTLKQVEAATGIDSGHLSRLERQVDHAMPHHAEKLVALLGDTGLNEMQVLYPSRFMSAASDLAQSTQST